MIFGKQVLRILQEIYPNRAFSMSSETIPSRIDDKEALCMILYEIVKVSSKDAILYKDYVVDEIERLAKINKYELLGIIVSIVLIIVLGIVFVTLSKKTLQKTTQKNTSSLHIHTPLRGSSEIM